MQPLDLARLERAFDMHASDAPHSRRYDMEGLVLSCDRYCAPDIAARYIDPRLMEQTDAEAAAEDATWD